MKINQQLLQINRNVIICFIITASISAIVAQLLGDIENHINTTITIAVGYAVYFGIFSILFYRDNKKRYNQMHASDIKKEIFKIISSFGLGEIIFLGIRWPSLYYFLEIEIEPFLASIVSEIIATVCYMAFVTVFLKKTKTF